MSKALVEESSLYAVASAIRQKGGSGQYKPGEMAAAVLALPGPSTLVSKSITANGSYDPDDDNADGYSGVTVNVPNSYAAGDEGKVVQSGALVAQTSATKTANGTYDTTLNNEIVVNVPSAAPDLGTKTITENGTYAAEDDSLDGYSEVTVNVSGGGGGNGLLTPYAKDLDTGYVNTGVWYFGQSSALKSDVYQVESGKRYAFGLGPVIGNRFRTMFSTQNPVTATANFNGTAVGSDLSAPQAYVQYTGYTAFLAPENGYLTIFKANDGTNNAQSWCLCVTDAFSS